MANILGFVARLGARLPFLFVVALLYGKEIFGQYLFAVTLVETSTAIILFGFKRSLFHFLNDDLHRGNRTGVYNTILSSLIICTGIGSILILPVYVWHDFLLQLFSGEITRGIFMLLPASILYAYAEILLTATRAARKMRYEVTAKSIIEPYVLLGFSAALFFLGHVTYGLFIAYWAMNLSILCYALYAFNKIYEKNIRIRHSPSWHKIKSMIKFSMPTAAYDLIGVLTLRIDVYFLAAIVSPGALGIYGIALQVMTIVKKIRQSFDPILEPVISQAVNHTSIEFVSKELSRVSYWIFSLQAMIFTLLIFYGAALLKLFNVSGNNAHETLLFLTAAIIVQGSFGLSELVFLYKKPGINPVLSSVILVLHAILCYFLSVKYGIVGAAISIFISYSVMESVRLILVKLIFNAVPFDHTILKPIIMSSILYSFLSLLTSAVEIQSVPGLLLGVSGGIAIYFLSFLMIAQKEEKYILMKKLKLKKS